MKKNAIKITLFVLCVAVTIFLLLPFFERSNSNTASLNVKAEPQIFTSNPLTALMNRLASLFGRPIKEKPSTVLTNQQVDQMFGTQVPSPQTAGVNPSSALQNSSQPSPESSSWEQPTRVDMSDALVLNEEGNWVLARQVYPESSPQGMHEINIKDNPYDTYIRQQKAAQYNPALEQPGISTPTSQSESYWHKLITPIKHFFGFDEAKAVTPGQFQQMAGAGSPNATALVTNPVNDANLNQSRANASGEKISSPDFSLDASSWLSTPEGKIQQQMRDLYSRLNPESFLEHAVDALANSKFKEPLTEKQRQQKEEFVKETKQNLSEKLKEWQRARMDKISTNRSIVEHFEGACYNKSLPNTQSCFRTEIIPPTDQEIVQNTQQTNQQNFQNITHMPLPHIPFTPVLG
ncbi:MAG: hypothetical protein J5601_01615, partial [Elusimicrobiaceae bacterium]|nr:hypothetical protein [Elusimicrobiaceae bacterium]